jgi:protein phosphatase
MRAGQFRRITTDHTRLAARVGTAGVSAAAAKTHRSAKSLTKSLGEKSFSSDYVDRVDLDLQNDDLLILCSDGIWTEFEDAELAACVLHTSFGDLASELAKTALARDPSDDASVIAVRCR